MPTAFWVGLVLLLGGSIAFAVFQDEVTKWLDTYSHSVGGPRIGLKIAKLIYMLVDLFRAFRYVSLRRQNGMTAWAALGMWISFAIMLAGGVLMIRAVQ